MIKLFKKVKIFNYYFGFATSILVTFFITLAISALYAQTQPNNWQGPTAPPPQNNAPGYIWNVGDGDLSQSGNINLQGSRGSINTKTGSVSIPNISGDNSGNLTGFLNITGRNIIGQELCLPDVQGCISSWSALIPIIGGGFWEANGNNIYNTNSGNVGIGTPSPAYKLDVFGNARFTNTLNTLMIDSTSGISGTGGFSLNIDGVSVNGMSAKYVAAASNASVTYGLTNTSNITGYLTLKTKGADRLYINADGKVGIGTVSPAEKFEVRDDTAGIAKIRVTDTSQNPEINLQYGTGANDHWSLYVDQAQDDLRFWGEGNNRIFISRQGNVGIATNAVVNNKVGILGETVSGSDRMGLKVDNPATAQEQILSGSILARNWPQVSGTNDDFVYGAEGWVGDGNPNFLVDGVLGVYNSQKKINAAVFGKTGLASGNPDTIINRINIRPNKGNLVDEWQELWAGYFAGNVYVGDQLSGPSNPSNLRLYVGGNMGIGSSAELANFPPNPNTRLSVTRVGVNGQQGAAIESISSLPNENIPMSATIAQNWPQINGTQHDLISAFSGAIADDDASSDSTQDWQLNSALSVYNSQLRTNAAVYGSAVKRTDNTKLAYSANMGPNDGAVGGIDDQFLWAGYFAGDVYIGDQTLGVNNPSPANLRLYVGGNVAIGDSAELANFPPNPNARLSVTRVGANGDQRFAVLVNASLSGGENMPISASLGNTWQQIKSSNPKGKQDAAFGVSGVIADDDGKTDPNQDWQLNGHLAAYNSEQKVNAAVYGASTRRTNTLQLMTYANMGKNIDGNDNWQNLWAGYFAGNVYIGDKFIQSSTAISQKLTVDGNVKVNGNVEVAGAVNSQKWACGDAPLIPCSPVSYGSDFKDVNCPAGYRIITGGAYCWDGMRENRPVSWNSTLNGFTGWRVACLNNNWGTFNVVCERAQ